MDNGENQNLHQNRLCEQQQQQKKKKKKKKKQHHTQLAGLAEGHVKDDPVALELAEPVGGAAGHHARELGLKVRIRRHNAAVHGVAAVAKIERKKSL
jgi:hypothetical protein